MSVAYKKKTVLSFLHKAITFAHTFSARLITNREHRISLLRDGGQIIPKISNGGVPGGTKATVRKTLFVHASQERFPRYIMATDNQYSARESVRRARQLMHGSLVRSRSWSEFRASSSESAGVKSLGRGASPSLLAAVGTIHMEEELV